MFVRNWFPLTDYDFWAYLASGGVAVSSIFYAVTGDNFLFYTNWPVPLIVAWTLVAYLAGHAIASLSMFVIEEWFARTVLCPPTRVLLGRLPRTKFRKFAARILAGRYYRELPDTLRDKILVEARKRLGVADHEYLSDESVFQIGYIAARENEDGRVRVDEFRNKYGFCRNMTLSGLIAFAAFGGRFLEDNSSFDCWIALAALALSYTMLLRFLMFYSHFAAEVLRSPVR